VRVLLLPGWLNSGPAHWQSRWEALYGDLRVDQANWERPVRADWVARLEDVISSQPGPVALVAHSLGCHLAAAWSARSPVSKRVRCALLVAPPDIERADMSPDLHRWRPIVRRPLPFAALAVTSTDDPYCTEQRAEAMLVPWGCQCRSVGARGHINGESGLGDWPEGRAWLDALCAAAPEAAGSAAGVARRVPKR